MISQRHPSSALPSSRPTTPESGTSEVSQSAPCICDTGDGTGNYIQCDNEDCRIGWYHWGCVQVIDEPAGTWLCPSCSPNAAFYIKQLVKIPAASSLIPERDKPVNPSPSKGKEVTHKSTAKPTPSLSKEKEHVSEVEIREVAKKGTATKKPAPAKPKPKWKGWLEVASDDEEEYKKKVEAQWAVDILEGRRAKGSKAVANENEGSSLRPRNRSRAAEKEIETDTRSDEEEETDGESVYQQDEQEETSSSDEASMHEEASVSEDEDVSANGDLFLYQDEEDYMEASVEDDASVEDNLFVSQEEDTSVNDNMFVSQDEEDSMDVEEVSDEMQESSADEPSKHSSDSERERHVSPESIQSNVTPDPDHEDIVSEDEAESLDDSMDMDINEDQSVEARRSELSDGSEYRDDDDASVPSQLPANVTDGRDAANPISISADSTPATSPDGRDAANPIFISPESTPESTPATSPVLRGSQPVTGHGKEDTMEIDAEAPADESHNPAAPYQRQGSLWGGFPESAVRSTLARLA